MLHVSRRSGVLPDGVRQQQVKAVLRNHRTELPWSYVSEHEWRCIMEPSPCRRMGAVLGCHTQDRTERVFFFVLGKKLAFTQTQVQSAFEHVINSEKLVDSQVK